MSVTTAFPNPYQRYSVDNAVINLHSYSNTNSINIGGDQFVHLTVHSFVSIGAIHDINAKPVYAKIYS